VKPRDLPLAQRPQQNAGDTYYGMPAVKPPPFGWHVAAYLFLSALGGASQIVATLAGLFGGARMKTVANYGRDIATAAALTGPALLILDLKTPRRFYNMLRIVRRTSPMSIGSYTLTAFAATSTVAAAASASDTDARLQPLFDAPAAAAGAGMLVYTGAMFASTSTPLWAAQSPLLSARYAASGFACASAALAMIETLHGRRSNAAALERLGVTATVAYAAISECAEAKARAAHAASALDEPRMGALHRASKALAVAVPLACHALKALAPRRTRSLSLVAALSTLAGTALARYVDLYAGKASAKKPRDYLTLTENER
jgi:formate-dependent nitrite reductase membrane component NrfD